MASEDTSKLPDSVDVAIVGAGPAGSTLAALLKKYHPDLSVWVFEKAVFPRHKVGEGLIVDINRILADMGCLDELEAMGYPRKYGTTFVWGDERSPSTFLFRDGEALVGCPEGYQLEYTWHVDRPSYDALLAACAQSHGAEVRFAHHVDTILETDGRVVGLEVLDADGRRTSIASKWVIDCAGKGGPLTRVRGARTLDDELRNVAMFAYHRRLGWTDALQGPPELRRTLIMSHPKGWVWLIPINRDETSVGFVTRLSTFQEEKKRRGGSLDIEAYYHEVLRELPEYAELFADSEVFRYRDSDRLVHTVQEFSFSCDTTVGPGWASCGDAAGFVDAILSIGCYVAQNHAQLLAYTLGSVLSGECDEGVAMQSYATTLRENLDAFRAVTHLFYAYNSSRSDWWRECSTLLRESVYVPDGAEKASFLAFANGFSARHGLYEEAVNAFGNSFLLGLGGSLFPGEGVFEDGEGGCPFRDPSEVLTRDPVLRMKVAWTCEPFALPAIGTGRLVPVDRLEFDRDVPEGQAIARRLVVPKGQGATVDLFDGRRRLSQVIEQPEALGDAPATALLALRLLRAGAAEACPVGDA